MKAVKMFNSMKSGTKLFVSNYGKALAKSIDGVDFVVHASLILLGFSLGIGYAIITFNISIENLKTIIGPDISGLLLVIILVFSALMMSLQAVFAVMDNDEKVIK